MCPALFGMLATGDLTAVATDWLPIDRSPAAAAGGEREIRMGGGSILVYALCFCRLHDRVGRFMKLLAAGVVVVAKICRDF